MSRPIKSRRELDQRLEDWPPVNRNNIVHNRIQGKNSTKFFSKTLICKRKPHIKLFCPLCPTQCLTFSDYKKHLYADKHLRALGRRITVIERDIENKRREQAEAQAAVDRAAKIQGTSSAVVKYCAVCDLNFYQEESKHIASKLHIVLQKLLEPKCNICSYQAKDAVDYENHICSLDHLKREEIWTNKTKEYYFQPFEHVFKSNENNAEEATTSTKDDVSEPSTSGEAMIIQSSTEVSDDQTKNTIKNSSCGEQEDIFTATTTTYCACCNLWFDCEEGLEAAKVKHCNTQQHLEMWVKYVEGNSKPQDQSKE